MSERVDMDDVGKRLETLLAKAKRDQAEFKEFTLIASNRRITVNKQTHRIRFEGETEDSVTIIIERKDQGMKN